MNKTKDVLAIVRDVLIIVCLLIAMWVGWGVADSTREASKPAPRETACLTVSCPVSK